MPQNMNNVLKLPSRGAIALEGGHRVRPFTFGFKLIDKVLGGALTESGEELAMKTMYAQPANEAGIALQLINIAEQNKQEIRLRAEESRQPIDPQEIERDMKAFRIMNMFGHLKMTKAVLAAENNKIELRKKGEIELFDGAAPLILLNNTRRKTISLARQGETQPMKLLTTDVAQDPFLEDYRANGPWLEEDEASHAQKLIGVLEKAGS